MRQQNASPFATKTLTLGFSTSPKAVPGLGFELADVGSTIPITFGPIKRTSSQNGSPLSGKRFTFNHKTSHFFPKFPHLNDSNSLIRSDSWPPC
jgi:hypothetical protein